MENTMIKLKLTVFIAFLLVSLMGKSASGAPVVQGISGEIIDGEAVIVTGKGFGTHADYDNKSGYLNYIFEDCEAGLIVKEPKWDGGKGRITVNNNRIGSKYNVFHERRAKEMTYVDLFGDTVTESIRSGLKTDVTNTAPIHNYFISQWIRFPEDFGNISASRTNQIKLLMTTPFDNVGGKDYFQTRGNTPPPLRTETESGELSQSHGELEGYVPYGTWHRMDMWVSIPDATTGGIGEIKWWIDGKLIRTAKQTDGHLQPNAEDVHKIGLISFIGYIRNETDSSFSVQTDDHFLDFTMSRVEICGSPTWDDTVQKHCELQLPMSWADSSITFEVNLAAFQENTPLYLYVVDSTGGVNSSGFLLNGEAASSPITKPAVVKDFLPVKP